MMKCPTLGAIETEQKRSGLSALLSCKKKFKLPTAWAKDVAPKTERMSAKKEAHEDGEKR